LLYLTIVNDEKMIFFDKKTKSVGCLKSMKIM